MYKIYILFPLFVKIDFMKTVVCRFILSNKSEQRVCNKYCVIPGKPITGHF